jgi:adenylate kinase
MKKEKLAIIMLGPPGAGKGTQARLMSQSLAFPHVSTGDILREALKEQTELGKKAKSFMDSGALVPDDIVDAIIAERLGRADCNWGVILDGYPRTISQAEYLRSMLERDGTRILTIGVDVRNNELMKRLSSRWTCTKCGKIFNSNLDAGKGGGVCEDCGAELFQRKDDRTEVVAERLQVYHQMTKPLVQYYRDLDLYFEINGERPVEEIFCSIMAIINSNGR